MEEALQVTIWHVHKADTEKELLRERLGRIHSSVRQLLDSAAVLDLESRQNLARVLQMATPQEGMDLEQASGRWSQSASTEAPGGSSPLSNECLDSVCDTLEGMTALHCPSPQKPEEAAPEAASGAAEEHTALVADGGGGTGGSADVEEEEPPLDSSNEWEMVQEEAEGREQGKDDEESDETEEEEDDQGDILFRARAVVGELLDLFQGK